jgi:hypothetical protein
MMNLANFITSWQFLLFVAWPVILFMLVVAIRDLYNSVKNGAGDVESRPTLFDWEKEQDETR